MVKKLQHLFVLILLTSLFASFSFHVKQGGGRVKVVVIDPGHGGKDPGCLGVTHKEKEVALAVALKLEKYIKENFKDVTVILTRREDVFVDLEDRAQIANKAKADLFISIHCNAAGQPVMIKDPKTGKIKPKTFKNSRGKIVVLEKPNPVPYGTETYVMGMKNEQGKMQVALRENSAMLYEDNYEKRYEGFDPESEESYIIMSNYTSAYVIQSANLAMKLQAEYTNKAGRIDKGVHRQSIWVLWRTSMPSVLTELGYLTNPLEETFLASEKGQDYLAQAIFRGFRKYKDEMEGVKREYNDAFENQAPLQNENVLAKNGLLQKSEVAEETKTPEEKPELPETKKQDNPKSSENRQDSEVMLSPTNIAEQFMNESIVSGETTKEETKTEAQNNIVFKVQFASSDKMLDLKEDRFSAVIDVDFYKVANLLKYTSGMFDNVQAAVEHKNFLKQKGFPESFVIAFKNGQRIDLAEAKRLAEK
ncbi:MAG: N-acetylmuramoyl-L-alanine amidase [Bacteroidetes bacterium]|nr:N-acetylmuramoyl-L-alanine amidase [Bacteroidota bacterium]